MKDDLSVIRQGTVGANERIREYVRKHVLNNTSSAALVHGSDTRRIQPSSESEEDLCRAITRGSDVKFPVFVTQPDGTVRKLMKGQEALYR